MWYCFDQLLCARSTHKLAEIHNSQGFNFYFLKIIHKKSTRKQDCWISALKTTVVKVHSLEGSVTQVPIIRILYLSLFFSEPNWLKPEYRSGSATDVLDSESSLTQHQQWPHSSLEWAQLLWQQLPQLLIIPHLPCQQQLPWNTAPLQLQQLHTTIKTGATNTTNKQPTMASTTMPHQPQPQPMEASPVAVHLLLVAHLAVVAMQTAKTCHHLAAAAGQLINLATMVKQHLPCGWEIVAWQEWLDGQVELAWDLYHQNITGKQSSCNLKIFY